MDPGRIWGAPLRFERRIVPLAAVGISATAHLVLLPLVLSDRLPAPRPVVAARSGEIALVVEPAGRRAPPESSPPRVGRPSLPPRARSFEELTPFAGPEAGPTPMKELALPRAPEAEALLEHVPTVARAEPREKPRADAPEGVRAPRLAMGELRPRYPPGCRSGLHRPGGCEGRGAYEVEVDESGRAVSARVRESAGCAELDRSAIEFLLGARFEPASAGSDPVPWRGVFFVRFRLDEENSAGDKTSR